MKAVRFLISLLALGLAAAVQAAPATIHLVNGAVVIGEVTKIEGGKVYIKADLLGNLVINESDIASYSGLAPDQRLNLQRLQVQGAKHGVVRSGKSKSGTAGTSTKTTSLNEEAASSSVAGAAEAELPAAQHPVASGAIEVPPAATTAKKVYWAGELTVGGSYMSAPYKQGVVPGTVPGVTGAQLGLSGVQKSATASGSLVRATATDAVSLEGSFTYAEYEPSPKPVVDNYDLALAWNHALDARNYTVSRTIQSQDEIREIYHSFAEIAGVGHKWIDTPDDKLDIVPGLVLSNEKKGFIFDDKWELGYGGLENYTHKFNPYMSLEERILIRTLFQRSSFYGVDGYLGLVGMLSKTLGIKMGFTYNYDNSAPFRDLTIAGVPAVFYPNNKGILTFTTGLQFKFATPTP